VRHKEGNLTALIVVQKPARFVQDGLAHFQAPVDGRNAVGK
jgi:hypothetical protein